MESNQAAKIKIADSIKNQEVWNFLLTKMNVFIVYDKLLSRREN